MSAVDILRRARARISDSDMWAQNAFAISSGGAVVDPRDPAACRWCAIGAVMAETADDEAAEEALFLLEEAATSLLGCDADEANDNYDHRFVLDVFGVAIRLAAEDRS